MALIHQAIAPRLSLTSEQIKPLIDLAWSQFDQSQLEQALETFHKLLIVAQHHRHDNGIEVAINGLRFTTQELKLRSDPKQSAFMDQVWRSQIHPSQLM
ncbi:MAG: hypothetical protein HC873_09940 [Leptolyngbyaceae cyanobacterium SL_1_1]|nr:hypothetical protein [Leptolyngbyaceae cyanobacterium RM1_1_2]NJO09916.1 hypothetical protein [Leptolyngbyaceae cyanobacterium SL_1_1]